MRKIVLALSVIIFLSLAHTASAIELFCGEAATPNLLDTCSCPGVGPIMPRTETGQECCGWPNPADGNGCGDHEIVACGGSYPRSNLTKICNCTGTAGFDLPNGDFCCGYRPADGSTSACFPTPQGAVATNLKCGDIFTVTGPYTCPGTCPAQNYLGDPAKIICLSNNGGTGDGGAAASGQVTSTMLDNFNSAIFGATPDVKLTTPRGIIGKLLPYLLSFGGLILFIMLVWGGFEMLTGAADPKAQEAGKQRITAAIIGFILLFSSYWLAQLVQTIFGVSIL